MEFGLLLPAGQAQLAAGGSVRGLVETAVAVERLGFDSVWVGDSLRPPGLVLPVEWSDGADTLTGRPRGA